MLVVAENDRPATAGVSGALSDIVLIDPTIEIVCDPGVEGPVGALDDVDNPLVAG